MQANASFGDSLVFDGIDDVDVEANRIKKIKRQLYGRAGFELLRKLILLQ
ncbi:hypothetical protein ABZ642_41960 [Streptomyces sp. NPDC007157]